MVWDMCYGVGHVLDRHNACMMMTSSPNVLAPCKVLAQDQEHLPPHGVIPASHINPSTPHSSLTEHPAEDPKPHGDGLQLLPKALIITRGGSDE